MPNLSQTALNQIGLGDTIKFTVKDYNDTNTYVGEVVSICDYEMARSFEDVIARHQSMLIADSTLNEDISKYRFLVVKMYDGTRRPFAFDLDTGNSWFTNNEVDVIVPTTSWTITLTGCTRAQAITATYILKQQGYSCSLQ